ncbi:MAG: carboxypeptidase regulatory-like domain-containing protein [Planctomycetes bacterium]|nr:carboxypeptidase regulatory-like domain-containing protein [Planctomycetota bacterium]
MRFRPQQANGAAAQPPGPGRDDPVVARAWSEHTMLAGQPVGADQLVQLGVWSQDRVHRLADGGTVRFTAPGDYVVEAATPGGHVGRAAFRADNFSAGKIVRIPLERGRFVAGTVVGAVAGAPAPLRGAELTLQGGDPLGLVATTGGDGGFRIGPLLPGEITLLVRHGDHEPLAFGPVAGDGLRIVLRPLPQTALRGRVRARPGGQPIAGARLSWAPEGAAVVTALSGEDGTFQLAATGARAARLMIGAPGFVPYVELVEPGAAFLDYDLWPASPDERLALGLTARLVGSVVDRGGTPLQGVSVRWIPARLVPPPGVLGRRVLDGATLDLPRVAATGTDGAFVLEVSQFGPGRVCLAAAGPDATGGVAVEAVAGRTVDGLRLMQ